jgi:predicted nuclease of predicted toxin-antitoxin system
MKFKLDENLGSRTQHLFRAEGHDVETVRSQGLAGASDTHPFTVCQDEHRCMVTLDLDFADVVRFPPAKSGGVVVIRMPRNPSLPFLELLVRQFLWALKDMSVEGKLWVVEMGRIRVHESDFENGL